MAEEKPILYILLWLHLLLLLNYINLASVSNRREDTPLRLPLGCEWQRCSTNAMSNEELVLQQITPPEHLCQGSWSGDTRMCPAPADRFTDTAYYTSQVWTAAQSSCCRPGAGFPSFLCLAHSSHRTTFPTSCFQPWRDNVLQKTTSPRCCR